MKPTVPLRGFLYGWTLFLVIQTGTVAAVAVAFAKFTGVLLPWFAEDSFLLRAGPVSFNTQQLLGISVLVLLSWVNTLGLRYGAIVQNVFTIAKTGALLGLIALGLLYRNPEAVSKNFGEFWGSANWRLRQPPLRWPWPWWEHSSLPTLGITLPSPARRFVIPGAISPWQWVLALELFPCSTWPAICPF